MSSFHQDVLIVGAGLSGIDVACHLRRHCPQKTFSIIERRDSIGGTWDLFKYPGIRSDSDMSTLGYNFKPWTDNKVLADGPAIKNYIIEAAREYDVEKEIHFGMKVTSGRWNSETKLWTLTAVDEKTGKETIFTSNFIVACTGYYNYDEGYLPEFPDIDKFKGQVIHPQKWPEDLDYSGKKVVVIGSGATAVTLVPAMADKTSHITMLQRSPSYIYSLPENDPISEQLRKFLPENVVYRLARARNTALQRIFFEFAKKRPQAARRLLLGEVKKRMGPDVDMKHFTPSYNPWDERICAVPNGDLFKVLKQGKASIETDHIEKFTATGIRLKSGKLLKADIVVTATGLNLKLLGDVEVTIDGAPVNPSDHMTYRGAMVSNVPNAAIVLGYTNSSWTLKADLIAKYVCDLLNYMDKIGAKVALPDAEGAEQDTENVFAMQSGYVKRAEHLLPRQGLKTPWRLIHSYWYDLRQFSAVPVDDGVLKFDVESTADKPFSPRRVFNRLASALR